MTYTAMAAVSTFQLSSAASSLVLTRGPSDSLVRSTAAAAAKPAIRCQVNDRTDKQDSPSMASGRRTVLFGTMAASLAAALMASSPAAEARDVPLFGIKKKAAEVKEAVVSAAEAVESSVAETAEATLSEIPSLPEIPGLPPPVQAGIVLAADVAAVGIASAVVGSLVD